MAWKIDPLQAELNGLSGPRVGGDYLRSAGCFLFMRRPMAATSEANVAQRNSLAPKRCRSPTSHPNECRSEIRCLRPFASINRQVAPPACSSTTTSVIADKAICPFTRPLRQWGTSPSSQNARLRRNGPGRNTWPYLLNSCASISRQRRRQPEGRTCQGSK